MTPELLTEITRLSEKYPELRLCQLIGNALPAEEREKRDNDIYYVEDAELLRWLREFESKMDRLLGLRLASNPIKRTTP